MREGLRVNGERVAVIGGGIMGCCVALSLARAGRPITLFESARSILAGASRWNEGRIHLGYLYAGDRSAATARRLLAGGFAFAPIIEELLGEPLAPAVSQSEDLYLVVPGSVVSADDTAAYFAQVDELVAAQQGSYPGPIRPTERLSRRETGEIPAKDVLAGFRVPERSVNTVWLADRLAAAVRSDPRIELREGCPVTGLRADAPGDDAWRVTSPAGECRFGRVINCSWEGLPALDRCANLPPAGAWSHRYRVALFVDTEQPLAHPSVVLCTGPFGDIKNYDGRRFYLSWYPAGLLADTDALRPDPVAHRQRHGEIVAATRQGLVHHLPSAAAILDAAAALSVEGGWVFARGGGRLGDPRSTLHRRDLFGVRVRGSYLSVDTGKFSTAPALARQIAQMLLG